TCRGSLKNRTTAFAKTTKQWSRNCIGKSANFTWSSIGSKKKLPATIADRRAWIDPSDAQLSIGEQCALVGLSRSTYYHAGVGESDENLSLMRLIDEYFLENPFFGSR